MSQHPYPPHAPHLPPRSGGTSTLAIVLIVLGIFAFIGLVGGILAVYGVRSYLTSAKGAEATSTIGELQKRGAQAYEREEMFDGPALLGVEPGSPPPPSHRMCPSATRPVPASLRDVAAKKYSSSPTDWETDRASNAGFYCLKFSMENPQFFQYGYAATPKRFTVTAHGDLDGDGVPSTFEAESEVDSTSDTVRPTGQIKVTNKDE